MPTGTERWCAWCSDPIPSTMRSDAECCSTRCRQARHRFTRDVGRGVVSHHGGGPLRLAYADPPYPGRSRKYYGSHPDYAGEVDHEALIESLTGFDGWALSTSADALPGVRVAAWVRGERPTRAYGPLNAWEPVIYFGGRRDLSRRAPGDASRYAAAQGYASDLPAETTGAFAPPGPGGQSLVAQTQEGAWACERHRYAVGGGWIRDTPR